MAINIRIEGETGLIMLADELDSGNGGAIYAHPDEPNQLLKIWLNPTDQERRKLRAILDSPPELPSGLAQIARPLKGVLLEPSGTLAGFTMQRASGNPLADIANPSARPLAFQSYERRLRLVGKLAKAAEKLARQTVVLLDGLDPLNLIAGGPELWFVDVDGWQISANGTVYHAETVHPETCPPELIGLEICNTDLDHWHDAWCVGTVIVWLLTGHHPFDAKLQSPRSPKLQDRVADGLWPHARRAQRHGVHPHPGAPLDLLHWAMQELAVQCFDAGFHDRTLRPTPADWAAAIQKAIADKPFLDQIATIEAAAMQRQMAMGCTAIPKSAKPARHAGPNRHRVLAASTLATMLVVGVGGGVYHCVLSNNDKPELVLPTGVAYEGVPLATPEFWTNSVQSSPAEFQPVWSSRPIDVDKCMSTPEIWDRLHSQSQSRRRDRE